MAFSKSITDNAGVTSTYWVITSAHADFINQSVSVSIAGWLTQATFTANNKPSARRPYFFNVPFSVLPNTATGSIAMTDLYNAILAQLTNPGKNPSALVGATLVD